MATTKPQQTDLTPLPADMLEDGPLAIALREGHEPLITLRAVAKRQRKIERTINWLDTNIKRLADAGTLPPSKGTLDFPTSRVLIGYEPTTDYRNETIVDKGYPGFAQTMSAPPAETDDLTIIYRKLWDLTASAHIAGERLDRLMRTHLRDVLPDADDAPTYSTLTTSGPMGWTTVSVPSRIITVDAYYDEQTG